MALLNYTTQTSADKTVAEIQGILPYAQTNNGETVYQRYLNAGMAGLLLTDSAPIS